jgi:dTDP-4-dehydrorhamnose reductase
MDLHRPDLVLNLAAYTNVDAAEQHRQEAEAVNTAGAGNLARAAAAHDTPIVHVSTDYVFDGQKTDAYVETDNTNPINSYGKTKLAGERQVGGANPMHLVVRTAWLYSPFGQNFVSKLLAVAASGRSCDIVADQIGNPTSALDLAKALLVITRQLASTGWIGQSGVFHLASPEPMSRFDWAQTLMELSARMSGPVCSIRAAITDDFPTPAARPLRTILDSSRFNETFGFNFPSAEKSMGDVLRSMLR